MQPASNGYCALALEKAPEPCHPEFVEGCFFLELLAEFILSAAEGPFGERKGGKQTKVMNARSQRLPNPPNNYQQTN
ncbi:hypothetical protein HRG84_23155 [Flavisolibacter sp. BT320]|nr:hypothetical protein [Flavisolibacter longurius]